MDEEFPLWPLNCPKQELGHRLLRTSELLLVNNDLVDCTISCKNGNVQAHRLVLAATCSSVKELFTTVSLPTPCSHPVLFLKTSTAEDVQCALEFIYSGNTRIAANKLDDLLDVADQLGCELLRNAIQDSVNGGNNTTETMNAASSSSSVNLQNEFQSNCISDGTIKDEKPENIVADCTPNVDLLLGSNEANYNVDQREETDTDNESDSAIISPFQDVNDVKDNGEIGSTLNESVDKKPALPESIVTRSVSRQKAVSQQEEQPKPKASKISSDTEVAALINGEHLAEGFPNFQVKQELETDGLLDEVEEAIPLDFQFMSSTGLFTKDGEEIPRQCPWCQKVFKSLIAMQNHVKTHVDCNARPFKCDYCGHSFARSAHLKRHLRTHTGEKPYVCKVCHRAFARQDKLKGHMERHTVPGKKPFATGSGSLISSIRRTAQNMGSKVILKNPKAKKPIYGSSALNKTSRNKLGVQIPNGSGISISLATSPVNSLGNKNKHFLNPAARGLTVTPTFSPQFSNNGYSKTLNKIGSNNFLDK